MNNDFDISGLERPKKEEAKFKDPRNLGANRIYWYFNKITGELFEIKGELNASHLHRHKQFPYLWLGCTDGAEYRKDLEAINKKMMDKIRQEAMDLGLSGESKKEFMYTKSAEMTNEEEYKTEIYEAQKRDAMRAQQNKLSRVPRDFRRTDLAGNPISNIQDPEHSHIQLQ